MHGGFTQIEHTLHDAGRSQDVTRLRRAFQDVVGPEFRKVVEEHTGRRVVAFISGNHQDPDLLAEVFVLEPGLSDDLQAAD